MEGEYPMSATRVIAVVLMALVIAAAMIYFRR
jgi:hypothetical protein